MKKIANIILKIVLVIILVLVLGWYLFGEYGPLSANLNSKKEVEEETTVEEDSLKVTVEEDLMVEAVEEEPVEEEINKVTTIVFTGDVELSEYVQANYDNAGIGGVLSDSLLETLQNATYLMINNEFCFSERGEKADKQFTFRVNPNHVKLLQDMGVDVAGLANNHSLDFGREALSDTFDTLTEAGIEFVGAGNDLDEAAKLVTFTDDMGRTFGFMASSHVIPTYDWDIKCAGPGVFTFYDETELLKRVEEYSKQVDYLFVMTHWGVERTIELESYQVNDAHKLIDAGAAAVIGMHSHCLQPVEYYNGHPIFYSLGNFVFNTNIKDGAAVEFTISENNDLNVKMIPIVASGAKTSEAVEVNPDIFKTIENMSPTVTFDTEGNVLNK